MNKYFSEIKKNFGFGCMRLPMLENGEVDYGQFCKMVDIFLDNGFNYFDTAHGYLEGKSEIALRECLAKRYPRDKYILTNKLTTNYFNSEKDIEPFFDNQLKWCGVDYFDFYLMHSQNAEFYKKYKKCHAYEAAQKLKEKGKVKHVGLSFHDKAEVLDMILSEHPEIEVVQIQFNYIDYEDKLIQGRKCYEVCLKHKKPIIVMEPVKGGKLVKLPHKAQEIFDNLGSLSSASYAIRYAASFDSMAMIISGMSNLEQMQDNLSYMRDFRPLSEKEFAAIEKVCKILRNEDIIPCTECRYCVEGCPKHISIPDLFNCLNSKRQFDNNSDWYYHVHTQGHGKASDCIECGKCETICPQHLKIRSLLKEVAKSFEKQI